jgi:hypothetical protein
MPSDPAAPRTAAAPLATPQVARSRVTIGGFSAEADVAVTPVGMLAFGGLVAMILLSVVPIVRAARRRTPVVTAPPAPQDRIPATPE